jgi:hypothetical protein
MQWTATELLQLQQQQQDAVRLAYMRGIGLSILTPWVCCSSLLHMLQHFLRGTPLIAKFSSTALPVAELAWALLVTLVPTAGSSSSSRSRSNTGASRNTRPAIAPGVIAAGAQPVVRSLEKIIYFATHFGPFAMRGLSQPAVAGSVASAEAARSDALLQILLLYLACTAGSLQQQQAGTESAARGTRSSSSRRKSGAPAPHMLLLHALAPALQQLPASLSDLEVMHNIDHDELATWAVASVMGMSGFLIRRKQLLQPTAASSYGRYAATWAVGSSTAAAAASGSSSSSSSSTQQVSALPQDGLLLPLLLTLAELAELRHNTKGNWLLPIAVPAIVTVIEVGCQQLMPTGPGMSQHKAAAAQAAAGTAVADALAAPVFLQLGPALMQHYKEAAAAAAAAAAAPAGGSSNVGAPLSEEDLKVAISYMVLVLVVLRHSEWAVAVCSCAYTASSAVVTAHNNAGFADQLSLTSWVLQ